MSPSPGPWDTAATDRLKLLWGRGMSGGDIAADLTAFFHRTFTRNGVIGKAHRMDLAERPSPINLATDPRATKRGPKPHLTIEQKRENRAAIVRARYHAKKAANGRIHPDAMKVDRPRAKKPIPPTAMVVMTGGPEPLETITLEEAQDRKGCLWPSGHRPHLTFCGRNKPVTSSYCPEHFARAWRPTPARVRA